MRYAIVGNNDGPARVYRSLIEAGLPAPEIVGLQKKPSATVGRLYHQINRELRVIEQFDEALLIERLQPLQIDLIINVFGNFRFVRLLEKYECLNVHPSLLPAYRGRHPMHWALIRGEKTHGITIHRMNEQYDDGPILWQRKVSLSGDMSVAQLRESLMRILDREFGAFFDAFLKGLIVPRTNDPSLGSYFPPRRPEDSEIQPDERPEKIYRKTMALRSTDYPAFVRLEGKKHLLFFAEKADYGADFTPPKEKTIFKRDKIIEIHFPQSPYYLKLHAQQN